MAQASGVVPFVPHSLKPELRDSSPIQQVLEALHARIKARPLSGSPASYIPALAAANPEHFGIALATADGFIYEVGNTDVEFTVQSISKVFLYGMALEEVGLDEALVVTGVEPTGDAFNSISLYPDTGRPYNPMINAGAIACDGLLHRLHGKNAFEHVRKTFSAFAGRDLSVNQKVFECELATGHRNRAIAHLLRNFEIITGDVDEVLDVYFKQCSIGVTCMDLARMGATLANHGVQPRSGRKLMSPENVARVLSVMSSCGMYDYSGEWGFRVGLPAKSGVGGGILAVLPGQLAVAVFAPPLDEHGNSVRGVSVCEELARRFGLHLLNTPRVSGGVIRKDCTAAEVRSRRRRRSDAMKYLDDHGRAIRLLQLQGELSFFTVEAVVRTVMKRLRSTQFVILDLERAHAIDDSGVDLLLDLCRTLSGANASLILSRPRHLPSLLQAVAACDDVMTSVVDDPAEALELCENELLREVDGPATTIFEMPLAAQRLCEGLTEEELARLAPHSERLEYEPGQVIVREAEEGTHLYFVSQGQLSVVLGDPRKPTAVLARLQAGLCFGEMALVESKPRAASVRADTKVACYRLPYSVLVQPDFSEIRSKLLVNLARDLSARLRTANTEILNLL